VSREQNGTIVSLPQLEDNQGMLLREILPKGSHVALDVRRREMKVGQVLRSSLIVCRVYALRDTDTALLYYEYLTSNRDRFASVHII